MSSAASVVVFPKPWKFFQNLFNDNPKDVVFNSEMPRWLIMAFFETLHREAIWSQLKYRKNRLLTPHNLECWLLISGFWWLTLVFLLNLVMERISMFFTGVFIIYKWWAVHWGFHCRPIGRLSTSALYHQKISADGCFFGVLDPESTNQLSYIQSSHDMFQTHDFNQVHNPQIESYTSFSEPTICCKAKVVLWSQQNWKMAKSVTSWSYTRRFCVETLIEIWEIMGIYIFCTFCYHWIFKW